MRALVTMVGSGAGVALFSIRMTNCDSLTVDGEFTIDPSNGVLTVVRAQQPRTATTTHFSPSAWVCVETVTQQSALAVAAG